eukprot:6019470-Amphidinium_carterae.1
MYGGGKLLLKDCSMVQVVSPYNVTVLTVLVDKTLYRASLDCHRDLGQQGFVELIISSPGAWKSFQRETCHLVE